MRRTFKGEGEGPEVPADDAVEMALRHREVYPWTDAGAVEASIRVRSASASVIAAYKRFLNLLGMKSVARFPVLRNLHFAPEGRLTQFELSRRLNVTAASITYLIDCLEEEG